MTINCEAARDVIDAWALSALEPEESRAVEAHIAGCESCAMLAGDAQDASAAIAMTVPLQRAGSGLRTRVMRAAGWDAAAPRAQPIPTRWIAATAAAVGALAIGVLSWGIYVQNEVDDVRSTSAGLRADATSQSAEFATVRTQLIQVTEEANESAESNDAVLEIMTRDDVQRLQLHGTSAAPGASGRYVWSRSSGLGSLVALDMPDLPAGHAYCLWTVYENAWVLGGLFYTDDEGSGRLIVRNDDASAPPRGERGEFVGFAVTIEQEAPEGAIEHNGDTLLRGDVE